MLDGITDEIVVVGTVFLISKTNLNAGSFIGCLFFFPLPFELVVLVLEAVYLVAESFHTAL